MKTWTIRVDEILDKLVEENINALGYTSKAELVREAVRLFVLDKNISRLGLSTLDRERKNIKGIKPEIALKRLRSLTNDSELVKNTIKEERQIIEDALLKILGD